MAAPVYDTDLKVITSCDTNTGWSELSGHTSGSADAQETETYIQGSAAVSQPTGQAINQTAGMEYDYGSNITFGAGDCFWMWQIFTSPGAIKDWGVGGMRMVAGSSSGNVYHWNAMGIDAYKYPYGGWQNTAVDIVNAPQDGVDGSPAGTWRIFGSLPNIAARVTKGNPHAVDVLRYGRGDLIMTNGDVTNGYATFAGASAYNDNSSNRFGMLQAEGIGYLWKGLMSLGTASTAVDFRDSNTSITIDWTPKTYADFNKIEINNASSRVDWTNISFAWSSPYSTGPYAMSSGYLEVVDDCDVNFDSCQFTDMATHIYKASSSVLSTVFRRCAQVTANSADFSDSTFTDANVGTGEAALLWDTNVDTQTKLAGVTFIKGDGTTHAIELGTNVPSTITLSGVTVSGYSASNGQNDSVVYNNSGKSVTINLSGCTGTFTYRNGTSASTTFAQTNTLTLTGLKNPSEVRVFDAGTTTEISGTGQENVTTGTFATSIDAATYPSVDISILSLGYQNTRLLDVDMSSGNRSIPVSQVVDRQYLNP